MFFHTVKWLSVVLCMCLVYPVHSQVLKRKAAFDLNWKFYKGVPSGTPSLSTYDDASWATVAVPHSPSYDSAVWSAEQKHYSGDFWYRKTFTCPAEAKKVFIEFEGAMSVATVYFNGTQIGLHDNSGYTPFFYDISNNITRGGSNVLALKLNNQNKSDIPPGQTIDFNMFGGLYRNVWLRFKDSVYIPIYGQQIITENVSAASATVHALTAVRNSSAASKTCQVVMTLYDGAASVTSKSAEMAIPANTLDTFDMKSDPITNPKLWSPASPNRYLVQTVVKVGGQVVDSIVEPCGIRWFTWNAAQGFYLNNSRLQIKGMCVHQTEGWIGDAVPVSRHNQEVKLLKNMGCNSIRCAHYPRDQAFYDICDRQGILVYAEVPTWGWGQTPNAARWARTDSCAREMVLSGRNHPCIYAWGVYNEPVPDPYVDFSPQITTINTTVKKFDTTRFTAMANINNSFAPNSWNEAIIIPDIVGLNYNNSTSFSGTSNKRWLNTESCQNFYRLAYRGGTVDLDTGTTTNDNGNGAAQWATMTNSMNTTGQLAGSHFWCFKDYNSSSNTNGYEGVVDRLTVPKTVFYLFRQKWTGVAPDYPRGGTATKIDFQSDTNSLYATGSEVFLLTATMRDANNRQIAGATGNVTFTINPTSGGTIFGGNSQPAMAGRAGVFLRTSTTPGTITVSAAYSGLTSASITLTTLPISESYYENAVPVLDAPVRPSVEDFHLTVTPSTKGYRINCPTASGRLAIINSMGKTVMSRETAKGSAIVITNRSLGTGLFYVVWSNGEKRLVSRLVAINK